MPRIRFKRDYLVKPDGPAHKAGEVLEVSEASSQHFVNRGAAEVLRDEEPRRPEAKKPTPPAPPEK